MVKLLKSILDFYINSSIHVALSVVSLVVITYMDMAIPIDNTLLCVVFFATISGYNFVKYFGLTQFHYRALTNRLRWIQIISILSFIIMSICLLYMQLMELVLLFFLAVLTFLYASPSFLFFRHYSISKNLRQVRGIKIYITALVWSLSTVLLPVIELISSLDYSVYLLLFQRFIFVLVLILPFEIRDLNYDSLKLGTIPQRYGIGTTKWVGYFFLLFIFILELFKTTVISFQLEVFLLVILTTALFVKKSSVDRNQYYTSFWVEAIPIFWGMLYLT